MEWIAVKIKNAIVAVGLCVGMSSLANAQTYQFTDLGLGSANGINEAGQIVGINGHTSRATVWNGTTATDIGALGSTATAINNSGMVVGYSPTLDNLALHATIWNGSTTTDLGTLGGWLGQASGISDLGQVVGYSFTTGNASGRAFFAYGGSMSALGTLPGGDFGAATAINNSGQVVGYANSAESGSQATLWNGTAITALGTLGGSFSQALGINDIGEVVGAASVAGNSIAHAVIWSGTNAIELGTLSWAMGSYAEDINNSGKAVGYSTSQNHEISHATLWSDGAAIDLNTFLDASTVNAGWVLTEAKGINDNGWIVGNATNSLTHQGSAFLLAPIPEPETYAMMLAGLGLLGAVARHRRQNLNA